jgi:hypothetical protein
MELRRIPSGALAGAAAAAVWAAQQPLDKKVFGVEYDDVELLGKFFTREPAWLPIGIAAHVFNGAAFGAIYANVAPSLPGPRAAWGPLAGLAEHLATWPLTIAVDRVHPARDELPGLSASWRAFAQATWRHVLFGVVLGELERRLNAPQDPEIPSYEHVISSNGHGHLQHAGTIPAPDSDS